MKIIVNSDAGGDVCSLKNKWNPQSLNWRSKYINETYDSPCYIEIIDDDGDNMIDGIFSLPEEKAYMVLVRVHFGTKLVGNSDKVAYLKKLMNYFFNPANLQYKTAAIYLDFVGSNISDEIAEEAGFFNGLSSDLIRLNNIPVALSPFFNIDKSIPDSVTKQDRIEIGKRFEGLKKQQKIWLQYRKEKLLPDAEGALKYFEGEGNATMIEAKKRDIKHYQAILKEMETAINVK